MQLVCIPWEPECGASHLASAVPCLEEKTKQAFLPPTHARSDRRSITKILQRLCLFFARCSHGVQMYSLVLICHYHIFVVYLSERLLSAPLDAKDIVDQPRMQHSRFSPPTVINSASCYISLHQVQLSIPHFPPVSLRPPLASSTTEGNYLYAWF